jgi:hypothetical protein
MRGRGAEFPGNGARRGDWRSRPGWLGVLVVVTAAAAGTAVTLLSRTDPGWVLGGLVVAGTVAGGIAVRARRAFLIIPVPAPAYAVGAIIAGLVHDRATDTSRTAITLSAVKWLADGFVAMAVATFLAVAIAAIRRALGRPARARSARARSAKGTSADGTSPNGAASSGGGSVHAGDAVDPADGAALRPTRRDDR